MQGRLLAVTAIGNDRPGIVAGVTKVLYDEGCNLEDTTSTILRGHFAMMLIVRAPFRVDAPDLEDKLAPVARELGLVITVRVVQEATLDVTEPTHMVSVYGADRPGIVFRVSDLLARMGVNITALNSRLIGPEERPVYALLLEVTLPPGAELETELARLGDELGVDVTVHRLEADVL